MDLQNNIFETLNLVDDVEVYTLQTYQKVLRLSEDLNECEERSPYRSPFSLNFLERYNCDEPTTSWIIRHIFAYSYYDANSNKLRHPFFESFAKTFLTDIGFKMDWIDAPKIIKEHEYEHIDVLVRDKKYAIIIENKLKGADFQLNQLARYIATMRNEHYSDEQIFVVVLPKDQVENDGLRPSVWKLPQDWNSPKCRNADNTCWCDNEGYERNEHCNQCESLMECFRERTLFIHKELSEWLYDCAENNATRIPEEELRRQYVLTSAILQFVDFLNELYQTRENNKFNMDIQNFLSDKLGLKGHTALDQLSIVIDKIDAVNELQSQLVSLRKVIFKNYIQHKYNVKVKIYPNNDEVEGYVEYGDKKLRLLVAYYSHSFYCQLEEMTGLPKNILESKYISNELDDPKGDECRIWKYDDYKESLQRFDKILGKLLEMKREYDAK